jgi:hypothetical protein
MRRIRDLLGLSAVLLATLGGCTLTEKELKPPKAPEEYRAPPEGDPRYCNPIDYPKETMDNDELAAKAKKKAASPKGMNGASFGGRPPGS